MRKSSVNLVPEPSTILLLGAGLVAVGFLRGRLKKLIGTPPKSSTHKYL